MPVPDMPATTTVTPTQRVQRVELDPANWKNWPVIPVVDTSLQKVYERGLALGNDPHSFSIFGDCQTQPDEFFGVFETDPTTLLFLSPEMRETVKNFEGSFNRESSTSQDGTTPGALLWIQWHRGEYGCTFAETPVECELRTHRPSFVIIQVGTHFESRNTEYLRKIILQLLDEGIVPILATKADNREKDERINRDMALLASEYDLPLWNFWAAVSDLPNRGLYTRKDRPLQGDIYLTDEAEMIHRAPQSLRSLASAPVGSCAVWLLRLWLLGSCALWLLRRLAPAPFGFCVVRALRRLGPAPFGFCVIRALRF
jgi:hypothetical protein